MRRTIPFISSGLLVAAALSALVACGNSSAVIDFPSGTGGAGGLTGSGGAPPAGSGGMGQGGMTSATSTDASSSMVASATASTVAASVTSTVATASSTVASSTVATAAASSSSTGGGMTCSSAADCGSASCGWSCTGGTCALAPKPKFTACYQDGGKGGSCDGAGTCKVWVPISTVNAPTARFNHSGIWTGTKLIVWGGFTKTGVTNTGHAYDPAADSWAPISLVNAPEARHNHRAVWTGTKMIVWGGYGTGGLATTGGIYDPATDTWAAMSTTNQPASRQAHAMVYTGSIVLVWGGRNANGAVNTGGRYNVATNTWTSMSATGAPSARFNFSFGWNAPSVKKPNGVFFVWGGSDNFDWFSNGAIYDIVTDSWVAMDMAPGNPPKAGVPPPTLLESATAFPQSPSQGLGFYVFGGWDGGDYYGDTLYFWDGGQVEADGYWYKLKAADPAAPSARARYSGLVLNAGIFLWGGCSGAACEDVLGDGSVWRPGPNGGTWTSFPEDAGLTKRMDPAAVWTGKATSEVIVWGGYAGGPVGTGARRAVNPG